MKVPALIIASIAVLSFQACSNAHANNTPKTNPQGHVVGNPHYNQGSTTGSGSTGSTGGSPSSSSTSGAGATAGAGAQAGASSNVGVGIDLKNTNTLSSSSKASNSTRVNNTAQGGKATSSSSATGGQGGSARAQGGTARAQGGTATSSSQGGRGGKGGVSNVTVNNNVPAGGGRLAGVAAPGFGAGGGDVNTTIVNPRQTSSAIAPALTATGNCLGSASGALQTGVFGIGGGSTKVDQGCDTWRDVSGMQAMGIPNEVILARMCQKPEFARAMLDAGKKCPIARPAEQNAGWNQNDPYLRKLNGLPPLPEGHTVQ